MDALILLIVFSPFILLVLLLVRHARRIHREANDQSLRTEHVDNLEPSQVQTVLERDRHTCQTCGATERVGVDFRGVTPAADEEITDEDLEACCTDCYLNQWPTLRAGPDSARERTGILPRIW